MYSDYDFSLPGFLPDPLFFLTHSNSHFLSLEHKWPLFGLQPVFVRALVSTTGRTKSECVLNKFMHT